ncbi:ATP-binding protein [Saccharothrix luteola]|uniref:ATP-binding protein n=1 Tax=Saccharothrix luteola TaxID=2893018 RepID=UPI001E65787A|nr:tetratricopeptide repeat protein [Saccharothrix luteola]MCC8251190.1 tetratricopeptide repeat protein [Saccharothrix luteola]
MSAHEPDVAPPTGTQAVTRIHGDLTATDNSTAVGAVHGGLHLHQSPPLPRIPAPRQLGPRPTAFVGRVDQLAALDRALTTDPHTGINKSRTGGAAVISSIGGTGGIGKTWLAQTWAHDHLHRFPDGQLSTDLRGFSPGQPRAPIDVLGDFLDALGIDRDNQPNDLEARIGLYRTRTNGRRLLILLDNAAHADQVVPLLPGGDTCTVLITSRDRLHSLIARHGARPVHLDTLTDADARTLLTTALDNTPTTPETERVITELIGLCGRFPLALGLIAARIRTDPHLLYDLAAELRELGLDALDSGDSHASLPTVLSWSLRYLTKQQRALFELLGIAPGLDASLPAVASLAGQPSRETRIMLRALTDVSLVTHLPGDRYSMHDLVRSYAATRANSLPQTDQLAALRRIIDFYLHTAYTASRILEPNGTTIQPNPPASGVQQYPMTDHSMAIAWLDAEHSCLLASQRTAFTYEWNDIVVQFACALSGLHFRRGHILDDLASWKAALNAAELLPSIDAHILTHRGLGFANAQVGKHYEAIRLLNESLSIARQRGDRAEEAHSQRVLAWVWAIQGDGRRALEHCRLALGLYRTVNLPTREANALNDLGWFAARLKDFDTARANCLAALAMHRQHGSATGEASTLDSLGYIAHSTGSHHEAIEHYKGSIALLAAHSFSAHLSDILDRLGHPHAALGQHTEARRAWQQALTIYQQQGRTADAERVQQQLDDLDTVIR